MEIEKIKNNYNSLNNKIKSYDKEIEKKEGDYKIL